MEKKGTDTMGMATCSQCGCSLKPENLERHLSKVHGKTVDEAAVPEAVTQSVSMGLSSRGLSASGKVQKMSKKDRRDLRRRVDENKTEARKTVLLRRKRKNVILVIFSVLAWVSVFTAYNLGVFEVSDNGEEYENLVEKTGKDEIRILKSNVTYDAKFYTYDDDGVQLRYFAVRGSDGSEHIAFDACDNCYDKKKGYMQVNDIMRCNNCDQEFEINSIGTENTQEGSCSPHYLPLTEEGNEIVIKTEDIEEKRYMFE